MKEIIKKFKRLQGKHDLWLIYSDFLEMMAIAISNSTERPFNKKRFEEREKEYLKISKKYTKDELMTFAEIYADIVNLQDKNVKKGNGFRDILGSLLMQLELGNKWNGQFFTPDSIANLMARINLDKNKIKEAIEKDGFVLGVDEAVGGGVTMLGLANTMLDLGYNPQQQLFIVCGDLDRKSCFMAYIQLAMAGIGAVVKNQDALESDVIKDSINPMNVWVTPSFYMNGWKYRLKYKKEKGKYEKIYKDVSELNDKNTRFYTVKLDGNQLELLVDFLEVGIGCGQQNCIFSDSETSDMMILHDKLMEVINENKNN